MVVVFKKDVTDEQKKSIEKFLQERNLKINEIVGQEATILAAVGKATSDEIKELAAVPGVEKVIPVSKTYEMARHEFEPEYASVEKEDFQLSFDKNFEEEKRADAAVYSFRCAYNGKKGAYAEQAVEDFFNHKVEAVSVTGFSEIFNAVIEGRVDFGMVPIENTTAGSVYQNYDNLVKFEDVSIVGAITLKIKHALLAVKGATYDTIKTVYSHMQALEQSSEFLGEHKNWILIDTVSTASAADFVAQTNSLENAAIANARNAGLYNLEVLKDGVQTNKNNFTRFVIIVSNKILQKDDEKKWPFEMKSPNRASIVFTTKNEPGALYNCLSVFKEKDINMNRLESRPIPSQPWKYRFYTDIVLDENNSPERQLKDVTEGLKKCTEDIRILGIYSE